MITEKEKEEWNKILDERNDFSKSIFDAHNKWIKYLEKYHYNLRFVNVKQETISQIIKEYYDNYSIYGELIQSIACSPVMLYSYIEFYGKYDWEIYLPDSINGFTYCGDTSGNKWGIQPNFPTLGIRDNDSSRYLGKISIEYSLPHAEKISKNTFLLDVGRHFGYGCTKGHSAILRTFSDYEKIAKNNAKEYIWNHHANDAISYKIYYSDEGYSIYMSTTIPESPIKERCIKSERVISSESENFKNAISWLHGMKIIPYIIHENEPYWTTDIPKESINITDYVDDKLKKYNIMKYKIVSGRWGYTIFKMVKGVFGNDLEEAWENCEHHYDTPENNMALAKNYLSSMMEKQIELDELEKKEMELKELEITKNIFDSGQDNQS